MLRDLLMEARAQDKKAIVIVLGEPMKVAWASADPEDAEVAHAIADAYYAVGATFDPRTGKWNLPDPPTADMISHIVKAAGFAMVDRALKGVQTSHA